MSLIRMGSSVRRVIVIVLAGVWALCAVHCLADSVTAHWHISPSGIPHHHHHALTELPHNHVPHDHNHNGHNRDRHSHDQHSQNESGEGHTHDSSNFDCCNVDGRVPATYVLEKLTNYRILIGASFGALLDFFIRSPLIAFQGFILHATDIRSPSMLALRVDALVAPNAPPQNFVL